MFSRTQHLDDSKYTYEYLSQKNVCRLCWKIAKDGKSIQNDEQLAQFITENIGLSVKDHILQTVCLMCVDTIESYTNYIQFCLEADQKLTQIIVAGTLTEKVDDLLTETRTCQVKKEVKIEYCTENLETTAKEPVKTIVTSNEVELSGNSLLKDDAKEKTLSPKDAGMSKDSLLSSKVCEKVKTQKSRRIMKKQLVYRCQICKVKFKTFSAYRGHKYKEHPDSTKFICEVCGCVLSTNTSFSNHMETHSEHRWKCSHCDYTGAVKKSLDRHIRRIHKRERRYACHMCPKRFFTGQYLNAHIKTHLGIKSFKCQICPNKYSTKVALERHKKLQHEGLVKQYKCIYCPADYNDINALRKHLFKMHGQKIKTCNGKIIYINNINEVNKEMGKNVDSVRMDKA